MYFSQFGKNNGQKFETKEVLNIHGTPFFKVVAIKRPTDPGPNFLVAHIWMRMMTKILELEPHHARVELLFPPMACENLHLTSDICTYLVKTAQWAIHSGKELFGS